MQKLIDFLRGKKAYIISSLYALDGIYQFFVQHGLSRQSLFNYLTVGGGIAAIRAAISKK